MKFGTLLVGIIAVVAYMSGVPFLPLLAFIIIGSCIEYWWLKSSEDPNRQG